MHIQPVIQHLQQLLAAFADDAPEHEQKARPYTLVRHHALKVQSAFALRVEIMVGRRDKIMKGDADFVDAGRIVIIGQISTTQHVNMPSSARSTACTRCNSSNIVLGGMSPL